MKFIEPKYCNSIHLIDAVKADSTTVLNDLFLNGVIGIRFINDEMGKKVQVTFNTETSTGIAERQTHWPRSTVKGNTLLAPMSPEGIIVKGLCYKNFDLLSNLSEGITNV